MHDNSVVVVQAKKKRPCPASVMDYGAVIRLLFASMDDLMPKCVVGENGKSFKSSALYNTIY